MTFILLFLFIVFIVVPLVSAMYKIWSFRRRMRRFMDDPFGQAGFGQSPFGRTSRSYENPRKQQTRERSGKKIPHDVGEYVAFTEYETSTDNATETGASGHRIRTENQITDVEWIDIEK